MRAAVHDRYGPPDVLRIEEVPRPVPADDEMLVRVRAATVNRTDVAWRRPEGLYMRPFSGLLRPRHRILGDEYAGVVEAVGPSVGDFAVGDEVFGVRAYLSEGFGAHAEYISVRSTSAVARKPAAMTFEEAAAVCDGGLTALSFLRKADVRAGQSVLVYGASGSIGTAAVQLARHAGATVTAVCGPRNADLARNLGAGEVLDYAKDDFTTNGRRYDAIFDAVGKLSFLRCRRSLRSRGTFGSSGGLLNFLLLPIASRAGSRRILFAPPLLTKESVLYLKGLIEAGDYRAVVDRVYPLEQIVEAARYVETGHKTGNVVLAMDGRR